MDGKNIRMSNFEFLRNIAMFMILTIHANFVCLAQPDFEEFSTNTLPTFVRYFIESFGIVSVNVFVLISGWFKIKASLYTILKFLFTVFFIWGGIYFLLLINNITTFSIKSLLTCFSFTSWDWFIKAYVVLILLSPVLNCFLEKTTLHQQKIAILLFFFYEMTYGWLGGASRFFVAGYGPLSFIPLYLLANYSKAVLEKKDEKSLSYKLFNRGFSFHIIIYLSTVFIDTIAAVFLLSRYNNEYNGLVYAYINPIIILGSFSLLLAFSKIRLRDNKLINWFGASSFAVYLVHSQIDIRKLFTEIVNYIYINSNSLQCFFYMSLFLFFVYILSVLIDQVRIFFWNIINKKIKKNKFLCTKI